MFILVLLSFILAYIFVKILPHPDFINNLTIGPDQDFNTLIQFIASFFIYWVLLLILAWYGSVRYFNKDNGEMHDDWGKIDDNTYNNIKWIEERGYIRNSSIENNGWIKNSIFIPYQMLDKVEFQNKVIQIEQVLFKIKKDD